MASSVMVASGIGSFVAASRTLPLMRASPTAKAFAAPKSSVIRQSARVLRMGLSPVVWNSMVKTNDRRRLFKRQIRLILEAALELLQQPHALVRLHAVLLDRDVDLLLHPLLQVAPVPLRHRQHLADRLARDLFLDVEAGLFVGIEEDVHLVHAPEEIVDVAHDVLIGAGEEGAEEVRLLGLDLVKRKGVAHVIEIDVLRDFAV